MANYRAVTNGNWSSLATWQDNSSGTYVQSTVLPGVNDDVYANGFIVQLNQDFTVNSLNNVAIANITTGGYFNLEDNRVISIIFRITTGSADCILYEGTSSATVIGDTFGSSTTDFRSGLRHNGTGTLTQIGNCYGSGNIGAARAGTPGTRNDGTGTFNLIGNCFGGNNLNAAGFQQNGSGNVNITGSVFSLLLGYGLRVIGIGNVDITGNVNGGNSIGLNIEQASIVSVTGIITSSNGFPAIVSTNNNAKIKISTPCINTNSINCIQVRNIELIDGYQYSWLYQTNMTGVNKTLYSAGVNLGNPATTDVRDGVSYASGALTGTLKVPPSTAVSVGVPVDNTVGSAVVTVTDLGALLASYNV